MLQEAFGPEYYTEQRLPYSQRRGYRPGHDTHHGHLPGNVIVKPAADVNLDEDAEHHTFGHDIHHKSTLEV